MPGEHLRHLVRNTFIGAVHLVQQDRLYDPHGPLLHLLWLRQVSNPPEQQGSFGLALVKTTGVDRQCRAFFSSLLPSPVRLDSELGYHLWRAELAL